MYNSIFYRLMWSDSVRMFFFYVAHFAGTVCLCYTNPNMNRTLEAFSGWLLHESLLAQFLLTKHFLVSAPQVDCLWRSSLKVPRATRPSSDCCSRTRKALVSFKNKRKHTPHHEHTNLNPALSRSTTQNSRLHWCKFILQVWLLFGLWWAVPLNFLLSLSKTLFFTSAVSCKWSAIFYVYTGWIISLQVLGLLLCYNKKKLITGNLFQRNGWIVATHYKQ